MSLILGLIVFLEIYFSGNIVFPTVRKNCSSYQEKFEAEGKKTFEIAGTIHSNSKRSKQFLVTE